MLGFIILGITLLIGFILIGNWFVNADTKSLVKAARWVAVGLAVLLLVVLFLTRAWQWLPALALAGLPWLSRLRMFRRMAKSARGPSGGQQSTVDTAYLQMSLDHDTGDMQGYVRQGQFEGRPLVSMTLDELLVLFDECRTGDEQSAAVLAAYLDREHPEWRERTDDSGATGSGASGGKMTVDEARRVLGVDVNATEAEIKDAHRKLMKQFHPDQGGSSYLAAKINEAKDVALAMAGR